LTDVKSGYVGDLVESVSYLVLNPHSPRTGTVITIST